MSRRSHSGNLSSLILQMLDTLLRLLRSANPIDLLGEICSFRGNGLRPKRSKKVIVQFSIEY